MTGRNWRVAIVGAGPAGMYAADALLKRGASVDVFERQFAPFGLVRYGVAPDHQKIKKTQVVFERILKQSGLRFFGNVSIGDEVTTGELLDLYDQVLITMGSSGARSLNIPGEDLRGSFSATEFVNWYNAHPDWVERTPPLDAKRAVVIGMGNVAIDVARILMRDPEELAATDISPLALEELRKTTRDEVILFARRGPNQAAFDEKEVRELASLRGFEVCVDGYISKRKTPMSEFIAQFPRADQCTGKRRVVLYFCASPVKILGKDHVEGIRVERNTLLESAARMRAVGTGKFIEVPTGLVVRSIGYHGVALRGVPFGNDTGTIPNEDGRVLTEHHGEVVPRLYVAGWIKRGPTGLIGTNKSCAVDTVKVMESDLDQVGPLHDPGAIVELLRQRQVRSISAEDWNRLDAYEKEAGARIGKARSKLLSLKEALIVLGEVA